MFKRYYPPEIPLQNRRFSNVLLLASKRTPFAVQKDSFCIPKVPLLQCKRTTFSEGDYFVVITLF